MSLTYTWSLTSLKKADIGDLSGIIVQTHWTCTGTDEEGNEGTFHGATPFDPDQVDPTNFTEFNNLTEEQVLGWIKAIVVGHYKDHVDAQIMKQINEKKRVVEEVTADALPWAVIAEA